MIASPLSHDLNSVVAVPGFPHGVLRVAAVFGPNASGKSNVLSAFRFITAAVKNSQNKWEPGSQIMRRPFLLNGLRDAPSKFFVDFLLEGVRYEYAFSVDDSSVLEEHLFAFPENRRQRLFERDPKKGPIVFGKNLSGRNKAIADLTRPDSLFLSAAAQNNHEKLLPIYDWFAHQVQFRTGLGGQPQARTIEVCSASEEARSRVLQLLKAADLGIVDMQIKEEEEPMEKTPFGVKFADLIREFMPSAAAKLNSKRRSVSFTHKGSDGSGVALPPDFESVGTMAYLAMLGPVIEALETGGVLFIDEIDASLHPLLVTEIVKIFNQGETNPRAAQLVFNAHDTQLLSAPLMRRDEVWFTEKDGMGATRLYPLSDFKPRKEENLQRNYLQGRYGATPFIDEAAFAGVE